MSQTARITGLVEYRDGDGPKHVIPEGYVEIETTEQDVTIAWAEEDTHHAAALPIGEFRRYVAEGAIEIPDTARAAA